MSRPRSDIQDRILAAAYARFLAEGVEATSLRTIAKDADTSIGMVYYYYTTKNDLFLAIVEDPYQAFLSDLEAILESRRGFRERMNGFYARIGSMSAAEWEMVQLIAREAMTSKERRDRLKRRFLRGHLPLLVRTILEGAASGEINRQLHPLLVVLCTFAFSGVSAILSQIGRQASNTCTDIHGMDGVPEFMREALRDFASHVPSSVEVAEQLSHIAAQAFGVSPKKK